ncbi:hypothetical protein GWO43_01895 [candidate division KSB1 bacterium]|nr:hypothetical protein [candidate division KSB1 bacterium]NIR69477.1 hypothetical protein [candidate division KSB1 bacterium]NIS22827.1 hypothetical protein [candidate division KSB1 bacterium]NIT69666.1 hypothetical protein [candidate division KSB1 bacterium]NIU23336.1 hypothetical protein [candidate division KSB1 bacterium]
MEMKDFAKYIKKKSFDKELHRIRKISYERILSSETFLEEEAGQSKRASSGKSTN